MTSLKQNGKSRKGEKIMTHYNKTRNVVAAVAALLMLAASPLAQAGSGFSQLPAGAVANPQIVGPEDPSKLITVTVWLRQHNKAAFDELVHQMYLPDSPNYHHFLTHQQYRSQFAPSAAEASQVQDYLTAHNLTVTSVDKYNHYVVAQGRVSDTQNAFSVQLSRVNFKGQVHRVSNASATIPGTVGELVLGVTGLSDFVPSPAVERRQNLATGKPIAPKPFLMADLVANSRLQNTCMAGPEQVTFTTPGGGPSATYRGQIYVPDPANLDYCPGYIPAQLQTAYGLNFLYNKGWDGTGQTIIIVDAWGSDTIEQDANTFSAAYGLPPLTSSNFQIYYPGGHTKCGKECIDGAWNLETTLDVEWAHSVAPGANISLVLAPDNKSLDIAEFWATENAEEITTPYANGDLGYVISNSWYNWELANLLYGGKSTLDTEYEMTELAAALGISANFCSGDGGDLVQVIYENYGVTVPPSVGMPASAPYATGVGGTSLFLDSQGHIRYQVGWGNNYTQLTYPSNEAPYDPPLAYGFEWGGGGGSSAIWPAPDFQSGLGNAYRQVPDISWLADPDTGVYIIITVDGVPTLQDVGGTSLATPMFSGLWAIANQAAGAKAPLGQAAPMLYSLPPRAITDIVPVSNAWNVKGKIVNPPQPVLVETTADLAQPLENTTTFLSTLYHEIPSDGLPNIWWVLTFGTDSSLVTTPGWDSVTGLGTPNGLEFVKAVVAAAP
jgi:subtilase family serine protease